jgi:hypothetical protein
VELYLLKFRSNLPPFFPPWGKVSEEEEEEEEEEKKKKKKKKCYYC